MIPQAKQPFQFFSRLSLTVMTGLKARDLLELLDFLKTVPDSVIYHHTHHYLEQHQYLVPEPPNDFAYWVTHILQEYNLGERLAAIDTVRFTSLEGLRQALVSAIESHVKANEGQLRRAPEGKELYLMRAIRFSLPTPFLAKNLSEFLESLKKVSTSSLYLHVFEARIRPPFGTNDFSDWFENQLGEKILAKKVASLDPYTQTMDGLRNKIAGFVQIRLEELSHAAS